MQRRWILQQKGGEKWEDKGYMGASFNKTKMEAEEGSGLMRGGARFRQEKRKRIVEGPTTIETQDCE